VCSSDLFHFHWNWRLIIRFTGVIHGNVSCEWSSIEFSSTSSLIDRTFINITDWVVGVSRTLLEEAGDLVSERFRFVGEILFFSLGFCLLFHFHWSWRLIIRFTGVIHGNVSCEWSSIEFSSASSLIDRTFINITDWVVGVSWSLLEEAGDLVSERFRFVGEILFFSLDRKSV